MIQYSNGCEWTNVEKTLQTLRICFPNSVIGCYRTKKRDRNVGVYCGKDKNTCKDKVYNGKDTEEDKEKAIVAAIRTHLGLEEENQ